MCGWSLHHYFRSLHWPNATLYLSSSYMVEAKVLRRIAQNQKKSQITVNEEEKIIAMMMMIMMMMNDGSISLNWYNGLVHVSRDCSMCKWEMTHWARFWTAFGPVSARWTTARSLMNNGSRICWPCKVDRNIGQHRVHHVPSKVAQWAV